MKGTGLVNFGAVAVGGVTVQLTLENGQKWQFGGVLAPAVGVSLSVPISSAEFGGLDHMEGSCFLGFAAIDGIIGGSAFRFFDTHGEIGHIEIMTVGVALGAGAGGGSWSKVDNFT